jgi:hypothetical protein
MTNKIQTRQVVKTWRVFKWRLAVSYIERLTLGGICNAAPKIGQ